ncbi:hypothetical protein DPM19_26090 [Actinomadura craniellae]|uniref:Uncharacterized protein n=1 Tax=Actinomadura craniellae TaxID=2231787 RepID=A0A365GZH5_9ACTN|nr:hypothetical protein [Actinomadura craniellae]RAY12196.1 hypothetical protein DPM19_26090 [Actinomadura craniellae]
MTAPCPGEPRGHYERWLHGLDRLPGRDRRPPPGAPDLVTRTARTWKAATLVIGRRAARRRP